MKAVADRQHPTDYDATTGLRDADGLAGKVPLGKRIRDGVERAAQLLEGVLYEGRLHALNSEAGEGKTIFGLGAALEVMQQGLPVLYLDAENGPDIIAKRLEDMGADPDALDRLFHYFSAPEITTDEAALADLRATVEDVRPALVVFDSLADFLARAGLDENSARDVTVWTALVPQPLKERGCAVLLLDHLSKGVEGRGRYARGSGAKLAKVDVSWLLTKSAPFDRQRVGEITLSLRKDREGYLPTRQRFAVGGEDGGLVFRRVSGAVQEPNTDGLSDRQRKVLDLLEGCRGEGATWGELEAEIGSKSTLSRALNELERRNLAIKRGNRYHPLETVEPEGRSGKPDQDGSAGFRPGSAEPKEPSKTGEVPQVPHPFRGGTVEPGAWNQITRNEGSK